ncbi:MAG: DUF72 domain-containing protein [Verrucomicrobiota bacterium]
MASKILVGTASWTDPGFIADWYPSTLPSAERLRYYAERFDLVEVNSSFYAVPMRRVVQRWCDETPPGFTFDVKLHRLFSRHSTSLKALPPALRPLAKVKSDKVLLTAELEKALADVFLQETAPLLCSRKLGAFLLQLTPAFSPRHHRLAELDSVFELFKEHPLAVELRNRHWITPENLAATTEFFRSRRVTFVGVDAPEGEHFMTMPSVDVVTQPALAYVRLHGRNLEGYVTGKTVAERFDYFYTPEDLAQIADRALKLSKEAAETHIIYNNNHSDYPLRNAAAFQQLLAAKDPELILLPRPNSPEPSPPASRPLEFDFSPRPSVGKSGG